MAVVSIPKVLCKPMPMSMGVGFEGPAKPMGIKTCMDSGCGLWYHGQRGVDVEGGMQAHRAPVTSNEPLFTSATAIFSHANWQWTGISSGWAKGVMDGQKGLWDHQGHIWLSIMSW